jgi:hypothetical protein
MSRIIIALALALVVSFTVGTYAADKKKDAGANNKEGTIKSVDAKAKTFVLDLPNRPLTFTVNDKTTITLDDKASTFDAAIKPDLRATVAYTRSGEDRIATKVEVKSAK